MFGERDKLSVWSFRKTQEKQLLFVQILTLLQQRLSKIFLETA